MIQTTKNETMNPLKKLLDFRKELIANGSPEVGSKRYKEIRAKHFNV